MSEEKRNKRQQRRQKAQKKAQASRLMTMGIIIIIAAAVVGIGVWNQAKPIVDIVKVDSNPRPMADHNMMGDPKAPIQIVEYADFQCPYCKNFYEQTEPLVDQYFVATGKIFYTYRSAGNWVSRNMGGVHTESQDAAAAAYCGGDQGKFWEMHDALFANNRDVEDQGSFTTKRLKAIAEAAGLDMNAFNSCYDGGKYEKQVQQDFTDATAAGIQGTPFFVMTYKVNGEVKTETIDGAQPIDVFQQKIEAALLIADK